MGTPDAALVGAVNAAMGSGEKGKGSLDRASNRQKEEGQAHFILFSTRSADTEKEGKNEIRLEENGVFCVKCWLSMKKWPVPQKRPLKKRELYCQSKQ